MAGGAEPAARVPPRPIGLCLCLLLACGGAPEGEPRELVVAAAASMRDVLSETGAAFERDHPGTTVLLTTGGSGLLAQQIVRGAPVDLFISTGREEIERVIAAGYSRGDAALEIARNRLVLAVRRNLAPPETLGDLADGRYSRIALGNPGTSPSGRHARRALAEIGLWETLQPRLVPTENVRQALEYIARGEVDAGFVYRTDTRIAGDRLGAVVPVPSSEPVAYTGLVLNGGNDRDAARRYVEFLVRGAGRDILREHGFEPAR